MPPLRPAARLLTAPSASHLRAAPRLHINQRANLTATARLQGGNHAQEDRYDPPGGWLFGVKPGEKYENEGWEKVWYWGFYGSLLIGVVAYCYKPDTSIQTWALEEARRRLEVEGILEDPEPKQ